MTGIPSSLQKRLSEGYSFSFGDYISKGFNLFQREIGLFIAAFLLFMLIQIALGFIPIVGGLISGFLVAPIVIVGFYIVGQKLDNEEKIELGDFFKGFEKIGNLALTALLQFLVVLASVLPGVILLLSTGFSESFFLDPDSSEINAGMLSLSALLIALPAVYLGVSYTWAYPLVWFFDLQPWQALETSRKLVGKNWFLIFAFLFVVGLIAGLGIIVLIIGILFTAPAMYMAQYSAFADVTGLLEEGEGGDTADIIDHFVPSE